MSEHIFLAYDDPRLTIRLLEAGDIGPIAAAFAAIGWNKPAAQYERYLSEQQQGTRQVLVALVDGTFAGYLTIVWESDYSAFQAQKLPEIQDFNVLPQVRKQGIGTRLMDAAEARIASRSSRVGIGVGMTADYGAAQRLYVRRGYVPDGNGLMSDNRPLSYGESITVDDALVLHLVKDLTV